MGVFLVLVVWGVGSNLVGLGRSWGGVRYLDDSERISGAT